MQNETEQKLKLTVANVISMVAVLGAIIVSYSTLSSRIAVLEKDSNERKELNSKFELKLDKIIESTNQIKVDMAGQRVLDAEKKYN